MSKIKTNKNYSYDIFMQAFARIFGGVLSFLAIFVLTYLFDEATIGEYNLVYSTINIITSLSTLWLSQSILRFYNNKNDLGFIILLLGICFLISIIIYTGYVSVSDVSVNIWAYLYILVLILYNIFDAVFRKERQLKEYVALEIALSVGRIFPMVILANITGDYNSIFMSQCLIILIFFAALLLREKKIIKNLEYKIDEKILLSYLKYGMPLMGLAISNWFLTTSDRYVIKFYQSNYEVGVYSTNYSLGNSIYMMFALILINAMHPIIVNMWERNRNEAVRLVSETIENYIIFMIPLVFYGCLKSRVLLGMFRGETYSAHSDIFIWTVLGIFMYGISLLCHKYYECTRQTNMILMINIIAALFNIISNFILIPILGFGVAAFTTFAAYVLYFIIVRILTYKKFKISVDFSILIKVMISVILFFFLDWFIVKYDSIFSFFIEGIIYVLYTCVYYQLTKVIDIRKIISKVYMR